MADNPLKANGQKSLTGSDSSMQCKGGSVNDGATRDKPAPTPKTLGPRTA